MAMDEEIRELFLFDTRAAHAHPLWKQVVQEMSWTVQM